MAFKTKGVIRHIGDVTEKGKYRFCEIVLEQPRFDTFTGEKLPSNFIVLEMSNNKMEEILEKFNEGNIVEVEFVASGVEYVNKAGEVRYFTKLRVWDMTMIRPYADRKSMTETSDLPSNAKGVGTVEDLPFDMP